MPGPVVIVDDLVDSGGTRDHYKKIAPNYPFFTLADHLQVPKKPGEWIVFPWEVGRDDTSADDIVTRLLQYIGEDVNREGLKDTPQRVLKAWTAWTAGYGQDIPALFKCFEDGSERYDEMVLVKGLPFFSHCEHHLAPFFGTATIGYVPNGKVIGLSKLGRVLDAFAQRLQVQERMTVQIADAIQEHLQPKGVGVLIQARHLCMESRGISKQGHDTTTSALRGVMLTEGKARAEFLGLALS
jgi:GTP cyclohydrolase I